MVIDVRCVPSDFHARYKAQERTLVSTISNFNIEKYCYMPRYALISALYLEVCA